MTSFLRFTFLLALAALGPALGAAEPARQAFDIPAGAAEESLKAFAVQSGAEVIFATQATAGVRTAALHGEFTVREAIDRLLAPTVLVAEQDARNGTFTVIRRHDPNADRAAPTAGVRPDHPVTEAAPLQLEAMEVTGSRIRRDPLEMQINPVTVFSRREIDRSGVTNIADFVGRITQVSDALTQQVATNNPSSGRTTVKIGRAHV